MLLYNLKLALRHLSQNKLFTIINIIGLSVGLACCILLILNVRYELSFDKFHTNKDKLFRIVHQSGSSMTYPLAPALKAELPQVVDYCRTWQENSGPFHVIRKDGSVAEKGLLFADSSFFNMFPFRLLRGNKNQVLRNPNGILLSVSMAKKYFGSTDIIGKTIDIKQLCKGVYTIEGVFEDFPLNSSIQASMIGSTLNTERLWGAEHINNWANTAFKTYLLLKKKESAKSLNPEINKIYQRNINEEWAKERKFRLQPLTEIHLYSAGIDNSEFNGNISKVMIFSTIAILILLIALINFITLSTAKSFSRLKEFGVKKVFGANMVNLIKNISCEFLFIYMASILLALLLVGILNPIFSNSFSFRMPQDLNSSLGLITLFIILTLFTGFFVSSYVTWIISKPHPIDVLNRCSHKQTCLGEKQEYFQGDPGHCSVSYPNSTDHMFNGNHKAKQTSA